jgi:hypothetical protein
MEEDVWLFAGNCFRDWLMDRVVQMPILSWVGAFAAMTTVLSMDWMLNV